MLNAEMNMPISGNRFSQCWRCVKPLLVIFALIVMGPQASWSEGGISDRAKMVHDLLPTVVSIAVQRSEAQTTPTSYVGALLRRPREKQATRAYVGSGFIIDPAGLIVTNYHVVENAFEITITLSDGTRLPGKTQAASRLVDLAVVKVQADHPLPAARWGDSELVQVGDQVFAAGNPFGIGLSISGGIVSGLDRDIQNSPYDDLIQTDATINHGNSGGPLFDMKGEVIGVNSTIISPTSGSSGVGFAIPSNGARFVVRQLMTYGWVNPGYIGIKVQQLTPEMAAALNLRRPDGSIVAWVQPDGPAAKAGLAAGDVIVNFGNEPQTDERAFLRFIARTSTGEAISLRVRRDGTERNVTITAGSWPRSQWEALDAPVPTKIPKMTIPADLGLSLSTPTRHRTSKMGLAADHDGVVITNVAAGTDAAQVGLVSGDVILRVQNKPVATTADVWNAVAAAREAKRDAIIALILPKVQERPGPKWVALKLAEPGS